MPSINNSVWLVHNHSIVFCVINAYYPQCFFQLDLQGHCFILTSGPLGTVAQLFLFMIGQYRVCVRKVFMLVTTIHVCGRMQKYQNQNHL